MWPERSSKQLGVVAKGEPIVRGADKVRIDELLADLITEYEVNGRTSLERVGSLSRRIYTLRRSASCDDRNDDWNSDGHNLGHSHRDTRHPRGGGTR